MITKEQIELARKNWITASNEIGFKIITPYVLPRTEISVEIFAFLPEYGSPYGTIIELTSPPEYNCNVLVSEWASFNKLFFSCINIYSILTYRKDFFQETLLDWGNYNIMKS